MGTNELSSNWKKLQASLKKERSLETLQNGSKPALPQTQHGIKRKRTAPHLEHRAITTHRRLPTFKSKKYLRLSSKMSSEVGATDKTIELEQPITGQTASSQTYGINDGLNTEAEIGKYLALDCEMVGIGPPPHLESALARISIVNYNGDCVYDSYVKPVESVTDWRTHVSGIAPKHMLHARTLQQVQSDVSALIKDRVLVGHSIRGDFDALLLSHPMRDIRDTARHPPYRKLAGGGSPKLKILASELLGLEIQTGEHSSIEDARATMLLFRRDKDAFEREHAKKWPARVVVAKQNEDADQSKMPRRKKKKKR